GDGVDNTITAFARFARQSPTLSHSHHTEPVPRREQPGASEARGATTHPATGRQCWRPGRTLQKTSTVLMTCFSPRDESSLTVPDASRTAYCSTSQPAGYLGERRFTAILILGLKTYRVWARACEWA